jgi:hypothetical protein
MTALSARTARKQHFRRKDYNIANFADGVSPGRLPKPKMPFSFFEVLHG